MLGTSNAVWIFALLRLARQTDVIFQQLCLSLVHSDLVAAEVIWESHHINLGSFLSDLLDLPEFLGHLEIGLCFYDIGQDMRLVDPHTITNSV